MATPIHVTMVHLAGFNTPQLDSARNRFAKRPQPAQAGMHRAPLDPFTERSHAFSAEWWK